MPQSSQAARTINFRHQVDRDTAIGKVYAAMSHTKDGRRLIEESLVNSLLPYAYQAENPSLAQETAQFCIQKLTAWIETLQRDFELTLPLVSEKILLPQTVSLAPIIEEIHLIRLAIASQTVEELRLIRESILGLQLSGELLLKHPGTPISQPRLNAEDVQVFLTGSTDFIGDLEEVL